MVDPSESLLQQTRLRCSVVERYIHQFIFPYERAVFPIFQRFSDGTSNLAGTGMFIAPSGIFLSAAHVFEIDVDKKDSFWMLYIDANEEPHELDLGEVKIRPKNRDIALGKVQLDNIEHPVVSIMELLPEVNEVMASFAFSHTLVHDPEEHSGEIVQRVQLRNHWEMGKIGEVFHDGFWQTPGPAFRSSILVEGRASGGPVFNSNGFVVGVNCRGMAPDDQVPYSIASSINGIRDLEFEGESIHVRRKDLKNEPIARIHRLVQNNT